MTKIYVVAGDTSLSTLNTQLRAKYSTLEIQGTNDLDHGVTHVGTKHIIEDYDAFIIISQPFDQVDLAAKKEISRKLNEYCLYAIKDLPIYFVHKEDNIKLVSYLRENLTGTNIHLYHFSAKLSLSDIESIIKEVLTDKEVKPSLEDEVQHNMRAYRESQERKQVETTLDRAFNLRKRRDSEDMLKLSHIENLVRQNQPTNSKGNAGIIEGDGPKIIEDLRNGLFAGESASPIIGLKSFDQSILKEKLNPTAIKQTLMESDPNYYAMDTYVQVLRDVISEVEKSDSPNKHEEILALLQERASSNHELHRIVTDLIAKTVKSSVDFIAEQGLRDLDTLRIYGESVDVSEELLKEDANVEQLIAQRDQIKNEIGHLASNLKFAFELMSKNLRAIGSESLLALQNDEKEIREYATQHQLDMTSVVLPSKREIVTLVNDTYAEAQKSFGALLDNANVLMGKVADIIRVDDTIIEKQRNIIGVMETQKVVKQISSSNQLHPKVLAIVGPDTAGKAHTGLNLAFTAKTKGQKVLLVDLNLRNPSVRYYNDKQDPMVDAPYWFNKFTIPMEEFIRLPVDNSMYRNIPYNEGITVIQPQRPVDLKDYESIVTPSAFDVHVKSYLEKLVNFYDRIILIMSEDLENTEDILDSVGTLYLVNDFNIINFEKCSALINKFSFKLHQIPVKHFLMNKFNKNNQIEIDRYLSLCGIDSRIFTIHRIPEFLTSISDKLNGNIPSEVNPNVRKTFDEVLRR